MDIGAGIFFASVLLSIVALYIQTKDRWNWRKISLISCAVLFGLSAIGVLGVYGYNLYKVRAVPQSEFLSISLTDKESDVLFKKGNPTSKHENVWAYVDSKNNQAILVFFSEKNVWAIQDVGDCYCNYISGIGKGTAYSDVISKLGKPSNISISNDQLERLLSFDRYNMVITLKENLVTEMGIYNKEYGQLKYTNESKEL